MTVGKRPDCRFLPDLPITRYVNPRIRASVLLPCLLAALSLAVPAQARASWGSMTAMAALTCNGAPGDPATTAVDTTATPPTGWQGAPVGVTLDATGAQHMEYMIDCATPAVTAPMGTTVTMPEGTHTLSHRAVDAGGLATNWVDETVQVDTTTPTNTTTDSSGWHTAAVNVAVQGSDATSSIGRVDWTLDGTPGSGTNGATVNVTGDGTHSLTTSVTDQGNHTSAPRTDTIQIDTVLPADATTYPAGWQYAPTSVDLYGTDAGSGVGHVEWKLDGGTVNTGPNHSSISIPEGTHTLSTQIVDLAGNASGWTDHTLQVDLTGPQDTTTVTAGWSTTSPQVITVKGTDTGGAGIQTVQWDVDNGTIAGSGPNNSTVTIAADGDHVLKTRVTDGSGTWSSWKTQHVQIDTVLPTDTTSATPGWQTAPLNVTVTGTDASSGIQHVEYQLDSAATPTVVVGTSAAVTVSGDGIHTLKTRVFDNAGNSSGWKLQTIAIDTTAPTNSTPAAPSGWLTGSYSVQANMADGGSGIDRMNYSVDGNPGTDISPLTTINVTGNGLHTLTTTAYDKAGNSSSRTDTIKIDGAPPVDTTVAPGGTVANHFQIAVTGTDSVSGVDHVEWYVDSGTPVQGATAQIDGVGPHTLHTRVWDLAGNTSGWRAIPVTVAVSGDTTPPTDTSTTANAGWYTTPTVNFTVSATDAASDVAYVQWRVGGANGSIQQGPSGSVIQITGDGIHHVETRAFDGSGNQSLWRAQSVKIDSGIPVDTSSLPTGWTTANTFTLSGTDATSGVQAIEYSVDGAASQTVPSGTAIPALADGTHTISHRAVDQAGQVSDWVDSVVKVDTAAPTNTSPAAPTGWQHSISLALTGTDAAGGSGFDHGEWAIVAPGNLCPAAGDASWQRGPATLTDDGTYTLCTRAVDAAGNVSGNRSETVKVDNTPPVNTTGAPAASWLPDTFNTTVSGVDPASGVSRVEWRLDSTTATPQTTSAVSVSTVGPHVLYTRIVDAAGNVSDWRADSFGIDRTAPTLTVSCGSDAWRTTAAACAVSANGGESGLAAVTVSRNGGPATGVNPAAGYGVADDGDWYLTFRAVDGAGNATTATAHVRVDKTAPAPTLACAADAGTGYTCSAHGSDATSGLASLTYTVDGGAPQAPGPDGSFSVAKGHVIAYATDVAGNSARSVGLIMSDRIVPAKTPARSVSEAVLRSGHGSVLSRALGELALNATASRSTVELRPLAVGSGRFQITMTLRADKLHKKYTKVVKAKKGYTPRVSFHVGGGAHVTVDLTVRKRAGRRWRSYASGGAELGG
jgi:hypothetical protein